MIAMSMSAIEPSRPEPDAAAENADGFDPHTDPMAPPREPCECYCLHCERVFMSSEMWFQRVINDPGGFPGFWMCPTPNCDGAGYLFDIFPTDPAHPDNRDCYGDEEGDEFDPEFDDIEDELDDASFAGLRDDGESDFDDESEYDPDEPKYKALDEEFAGEEYLCDEDYAGEEWKLGLEPGQRPPEPRWMIDSRSNWEQEQKKYDAPDERPRVLDWKDRQDHERGARPTSDEDIPF
jgi:hypothetical protein